MELYVTLYYLIRHGNIGLFCHTIREKYIILQVPSTFKPKYARKMMRRIHIFDTKAADLILQKTYPTNSSINLQRLSDSFYVVDLLLEYQNNKF